MKNKTIPIILSSHHLCHSDEQILLSVKQEFFPQVEQWMFYFLLFQCFQTFLRLKGLLVQVGWIGQEVGECGWDVAGVYAGSSSLSSVPPSCSVSQPDKLSQPLEK